MMGILPHPGSSLLRDVRVDRTAQRRVGEHPHGRCDDAAPRARQPHDRGHHVSTLLLLTSTTQPSADVLPALALLPHQVKILPAEGSALLEAPEVDVVLVDGRQDLAHARDLCRLIRTTGAISPLVLIVTERGLSVVA